MAVVRATAQQITRLASFSTCELADAIVKLTPPSNRVPTGGYVPALERFSGKEGETLVGEAFTVEMVAGTDTAAPKLSGHFVDLAEPESIVFVSTPEWVKSASLGGLLATALQVKGVKGFVTSGRVRDLAELRDLDFPVFARGHSILGQSPFTRVSRVQIPLKIHPPGDRFGDVWPVTEIHPYDLVVADTDGVFVVRPEMVEQVMDLAEKGREVDEKCRRDLLAGKGVQETFKLHRGK
ncbi:hypothetical protein JCM6882_005798 [Rhodosporidiobolus microsporus]